MFMWILHTEGLPIGTWLEKMAIDGSYKLCTTAPIETARHAFIECQEVKKAWIQFNHLRRIHNLPQLHLTPTDILEGAQLTSIDLMVRMFSNTCRVTE